MLLRPGVLTIAYVQGQRKPLVGPLQLFLIANVIFIMAQSLTHTNVFSSPLSSHIANQDWATLARPLVEQHLLACGTYLHIATAKVYGAKRNSQLLRTSMLTLVVAAHVPAYRFLIFAVTLITT